MVLPHVVAVLADEKLPCPQTYLLTFHRYRLAHVGSFFNFNLRYSPIRFNLLLDNIKPEDQYPSYNSPKE